MSPTSGTGIDGKLGWVSVFPLQRHCHQSGPSENYKIAKECADVTILFNVYLPILDSSPGRVKQ